MLAMRLVERALLPLVVVVAFVGSCALIDRQDRSREQRRCVTVGKEANRAVRWDRENGCRIEHGGVFVPLKNWKVSE